MKRLLLYQLLILFTFSAASQDVSVQVDYPAVVTAGQQFVISWTVNAGGGEFTPPSFRGFNKLMGPQTSYSSSTQIINGKMSQQTTYTYVYYIQAITGGRYVIAPAIFTLKNKTFASDSIRIEVISSSQNSNFPAGNEASGNQNGGSDRGDIFVNLSLDRKEVFLGEHLVATVKIYTRVNLSGINEIKYPSFNDFLKTDLVTPPLTSLKEENVGGTIYGTGTVQQFLLYPQKTGEITIDPVQISVLVQQRSGQSDPFFGDFFSSVQTVPKAVASSPVKINVKPLPGKQPDDFSGIVGRLSVDAIINKDSVKVNDAVNFKVIISGSGNLKIAAPPKLNLSPGIEVYDPKITDDIRNGINGSTGQKTFDYLLIPRHYGDFIIPPLSYSFFNTTTGRYETLTTEEYRFNASKGNEQNGAVTVYGGVSKEDVKYLGKDIRFIKSEAGKLTRSAGTMISDRLFYSTYAFALFAFMIVLFIRREHVRRNSDITLVRNRKAGKIASGRLRSAHSCLKNDEIEIFYEEILKAIWGYLSDKLNIPVSELTRSKAIEILTAKGVEEDHIKNMNQILDVCEYARFSPSAKGSEAIKIYDGASHFIRSIENSIE